MAHGGSGGGTVDWKQRRLATVGAERQLDEIEKRGLSNNQQNAATRFGTPPSKPTGLALNAQVGTVEVTWDASPSHDVLYYELNISSDPGFGSPRVVKVSENFYTYDSAVAGTTYYFRVRTVSPGPVESPWTSSTNSAPGEAATLTLAAKSASDFSDNLATNVILGTSAGASTDVTIVTAEVTIDEEFVGRGVQIHQQYTHAADGGGVTLTVKLERTNANGGTEDLLAFGILGSAGILASSGGSLNESYYDFNPGAAGTVTYRMYISAATNSGTDMGTMSSAQIFAQLVKR